MSPESYREAGLQGVAPSADDRSSRLRLAHGDGGPDQVEFECRGKESLALRVIHFGADDFVVGHMSELGQLLQRIHSSATTTSELLPPSWRRLQRWLDGFEVSPRERSALSRFKTEIGAELFALLKDWADEAFDPTDGVPLHGAPGLGDIVLDGYGGGAQLLTGPDAGTGSHRLDIGYALGEIYEVSWQRGDKGSSWQGSVDALVSSYGVEMDRGMHRAAALRVLLHLRDYLSYGGTEYDPTPYHAQFISHLCAIESSFN